MKRTLLFFAMLLTFGLAAQGQTTTVSGTVVDTAGFPWAAGTYSFSFVPGSPGPQMLDGAPFTPVTQSGVLDGTGSFSGVVLQSNDHIAPSNSKWNIQVCPNANAPCFITSILTTGPTQTIAPHPGPVLVTGAVRSVPVAYDDSEIVGPAEGFVYFNYTLNAGRVFHNGAFEPFGGASGGGTGLTQIGLTVQPGGIASVVGSPLIANGNLQWTLTGVVGGIPWFDLTNRLQSSGAITQDALVRGNNTSAPSSSSVTDDLIKPTRTPNGVNVAVNGMYVELQNAGTTGTTVNRLVCKTGSQAVICADNATTNIVGIAEFGAGTTGTVTVCMFAQCVATGDSAWTVGDYAIAGVNGQLHDTGSTTPTANNINFKIATTNSGAGTTGIVIPPGDLLGGSLGQASGVVSCLTTLGDIQGGGTAGVCTRIPAPTTLNGVFQFLGSAASGGIGTAPIYRGAGIVPRYVTSSPDPVVYTDRGGFIQYTSATPISVTLPQPGSTGFANNFVVCAQNRGAGLVTYTSTASTINGNATYSLSLGSNACFMSDNANWITKDSTSSASGAASGDLAGTFPSPTVSKIQGNPITVTSLAAGQVVSSLDGVNLTNNYSGVVPDARITTTEAITCANRFGYVTFSNVAATAVSLPAAGSTACFSANYGVLLQNLNDGLVTVTPASGTIGGGTALALGYGDWAFVYSNNVNYLTMTGHGGSSLPIATDTGVANAYIIIYPAITVFHKGNEILFTTANANTGASTLGVNLSGVKNLTKKGATALVAGDITANTIYRAQYDGTQWQLLNPSSVITCPTCTTSAASLASGNVITGAGGQAEQDSGTALTALAPLASPTFTGVPIAPTAAVSTNTTQVATTAFVMAQSPSITGAGSQWMGYCIYCLPGTSTSSAAMSITANVGIYFKFNLPVQAKITKISFYVNTGTAASTGDVGIYSISGTTGTLAAHSGSVATTTSGQMIATTITPVTLNPGQYYLSSCNTNTIVTTLALVTIGTNSGLLMGGTGAAANSWGPDATDGCTAGVLPATITTTNVTNVTTSTYSPIAALFSN